MIPVKRESDVLISTLKNPHEFRMKASAKAFEILSSTLYQNKIRAIIRELSCNAVDSHIQAENKDNFIVHLPTELDPTFYIRDFGTGINEDDMLDVFTVMFESTKDKENDSVGMFGLGSKSPFSYTDSFIITSFQNGYKHIYIAAFNDEKIPTLNKISEEKTDEKSGLKISFSVKKEDYGKFHSEASHVFKTFFDIKPTIKGNKLDVDELQKEMVYFGEKFIIDFKSSSTHSKFNLVQGGIAYPIDINRIKDFNYQNYNNCYSADFYILADIGTICIPPSRENISDSDENYSNINQILIDNETKKHVNKEMLDVLSKINTQKECSDLMVNHRDYKMKVYNFQFMKKRLVDKGFFVDDIMKIDKFHELKKDLEISVSGKMCGWTSVFRTEYMTKDKKQFKLVMNNFHLAFKYRYLIIDDYDKSRNRISHFKKSTEGCFLVVKNINHEKFKEFIDDYGEFFNIVKSSELDDPPKKEVVKIKKTEKEIFNDINNIDPSFRYSLSDLLEDENQPFYFLPSYSNDVVYDLKDRESVIRGVYGFISFLKNENLIEDYSILAVLRSKKDYVLNNFTNSIDLLEILRDELKKRYTKNKLKKILNSSLCISQSSEDTLNEIFKYKKAPLKKEYDKAQKNYDHFIYEIKRYIPKIFDFIYGEYYEIENIHDMIINEYKKKYPLIWEYINHSWNENKKENARKLLEAYGNEK